MRHTDNYNSIVVAIRSIIQCALKLLNDNQLILGLGHLNLIEIAQQ